MNAHLRIESPDGKDRFDDPEVLEDLERSRVTAFHLGQKCRRVFALDQRARNAAQAEVDRERHADRTTAGD